MSTVDCETNSCAGLFLGCAEEELSETDSTALNCFGERFQGSVTIAGMLKGVDFGLLDARIVEVFIAFFRNSANTIQSIHT